MYSDARGSVRITSDDPRVRPTIRFNYLSTDTDRKDWVEAIRLARHILNQPALDPFNGGEISPGSAGEKDEQRTDWVAPGAETPLPRRCPCRTGGEATPVTRPAADARRGAGR